MELITNEEAFNSLFINKEITFESLFHTAEENKLLSIDFINDIKDTFKNAIVGYIISMQDDIEDININLVVEKELTKIMFAINEYLNEFTSYNALYLIINSNPIDIIKKSIKYTESIQERLIKRYNELELIIKPYANKNYSINALLEYLKSSIVRKTNPVLYKLLNGIDVIRVTSLKELDALFDAIEIEFSILSKFNKTEVMKLITSQNPILDSKNIVEAALFNYVFNCFYKDEASIIITHEMASIIRHDIDSRLFNLSDATDVIELGPIEFTQEEKEYIFSRFIKTYNKDVIELHRKDVFVENY